MRPRETEHATFETMRRRDPAWRWARACSLARSGGQPRRGDDRPVREALAVLRWQARCRARRRAPARLAAVAGAVCLRDGDARRRWFVEAYLLAGAPPGEAASAGGVATPVVEAYHDVFHDVAGLLNAGDALMAFLLGGRKRHLLSPDDEEFFTKLYAVRGGPLAAESVRHYFENRHRLRHGPALERQEKLGLLRVHAAVLAHAAPRDPAHLGKLIELCRLTDRPSGDLVHLDDLTGPIRPAADVAELVRDLPQVGPDALPSPPAAACA